MEEGRDIPSHKRNKRSVCAFYNTPRGCALGKKCRYLHLRTTTLGEQERTAAAASPSRSPSHVDDRHFTRGSGYQRGAPTRGRGGWSGRPSHQRREGRGGGQEAAAKCHRDDESKHSSPQGPAEGERPTDSPLHSLLDFPQLGSRHRYHHTPVQSHGPASPALTIPSAPTASGGRGRGRGQLHRPTSEFSLGALLENATSKSHRPPVTRPSKISDSSSCDLLATELDQLHLRFLGDQLSLVEKSTAHQTYRLWYSPTDPEWPFIFKEVSLLVTFPRDYPKEVCSVTLEEGNNITLDTAARDVNEAMKEQLLTMRHSLGERALLFRPFLKWLDRNIGPLILAASHGDTAELQGGSSGSGGEGLGDMRNLEHSLEDEAVEVSDSDNGDSDDASDNEDSGGDDKDDVMLLKTTRMTKHGTEVRVRSMQVSQEVGLIQCSLMKATLLCRRCKEHMDVQLKPDKLLQSSCPRCGVFYGVQYSPSTLHPDCLTLGFLDLKDCLVHDVILFGSELTIVCLSCNKMTRTKGVHYGQPHTLWCQHCHHKMTVSIETCRLLEHEPGPALQLAAGDRERERREKRKKEFQIREGRPLPEKGTCAHYKKSCRWLRFPCCGKAYPCDICHDTKEDHSYERANRMVCGFCAKEQTYTVDKPCVVCKSALTGGPHTAYWEGGQGCRNKAKMSRNDPRKYANVSKTASKKMERVGFQGKMKILGNE